MTNEERAAAAIKLAEGLRGAFRYAQMLLLDAGERLEQPDCNTSDRFAYGEVMAVSGFILAAIDDESALVSFLKRIDAETN